MSSLRTWSAAVNDVEDEIVEKYFSSSYPGRYIHIFAVCLHMIKLLVFFSIDFPLLKL
jgi:hypothetical protein